MRNIETKARVEDISRVRQLALEIGAQFQKVQKDTDIYFHATHGRLKLRVTEGRQDGSLIAYDRADEPDSKVSDYILIDITDPDGLREALARSVGILVTVRKTRELLMYGDTRIHLDVVEGLGDFVELETVLGAQTIDAARAEHQYLLSRLELVQAELVAVSYSDLLIQRNGSAHSSAAQATR